MAELERIFLESKTANEFLTEAFRHLKARNSYFSYEYAARKGGFSSKTHLHQLIHGKRKLSLDYVPNISKAFSLSSDLKMSLSLLIEKERQGDDRELLARLKKMRARLRRSLKPHGKLKLKNIHFPFVYTALSPTGREYSLTDLHIKTALGKGTLRKVLHEMIEAKLVSKSTKGSYSGLFEHLNLGQLAGNEFFKKIFLSNLKRAKKACEDSFDSEKHLFFNSYLTINEEELDEFTTKLQKLLSDYCSDHIDEKGKKLVTVLATSFYS